MMKAIEDLLIGIYGDDVGKKTFVKIEHLIEYKIAKLEPPHGGWNENLPVNETDSLLITYGDQFKGDDKTPIEYLHDFLEAKLVGSISGVHILPFYPYSSDDGFSVIHYRQVNPDVGDWEHVRTVGDDFRLMFDLVLNHCSAKSLWFNGFLHDDEIFKDYFITVPEGTDVSGVFRPRALPLLSEYETPSGKKQVWTTFSADQVDLNFANPDVLIESIGILLYYVHQGAEIIRLDAIAYLWKELGTPCIHHPKTHMVVQLLRLILKDVAPWVALITETNVPHEDNISYFGNGKNEAHMVYQFSLPPLTVDAFIRGDASHLTRWASGLPSEGNGHTTFFNFLASHDGIGVLPAQGYLTQYDMKNMIGEIEKRGGKVSYKATADGDVPYELNISYRDAICEPWMPEDMKAQKFLASQAIMLSLMGVPGIYIHSLIGSGNWREGIKELGHNRAINREKLDYQQIIQELETPGTLRNRIFSGYLRLIKARRQYKAFHPSGSQNIINISPSVFAVLRISPDGKEKILCLQNVTKEPVHIDLPVAEVGARDEHRIQNIIFKTPAINTFVQGGRFITDLKPYEVQWLTL